MALWHLSRVSDAAMSPPTRVVFGLMNLFGLWLCAGVVALLRSPWQTPAMLLNLLAAAAFVLAFCAAARGGVPGRLLTFAGAANLLALLGVFALAAWEGDSGTPWQSVAGIVGMASPIPAINAAWWFFCRRKLG